ncbi:DUF1641 domain-containing protein [Paenibacillus xerothermodurans]|uniref:DUF1641 domain-containing protein n=1 Tax=Paenibacillus xerothermodurans TaxID=1977292 RepID=A0A2W1N9H7_PAEXE|nr:DUF1641 domain-containing protein [Paenibacillus xerothermodurans]PZE20584.1 DUF1641 domain-containing protein [Paenibacillus xerothermodurans]
MANAISYIERKIPTQEQLQAEAMAEILQKLTENKRTIIWALDLLNELSEAGVLDIIQGIMKNRSTMAAIGLDFINIANIPTMAKTVIGFTQLLGRIDPKTTEKLITGMEKGLNAAMKPDVEPQGVFALMGMMRDPNVRAAMSTGLRFMQGLGEGLNQKEAEMKK